MSYTFKVGDKGKTRNGVGYEVLLVDNRLDRPVRVLLNGEGILYPRNADGTAFMYLGHASDLMPPSHTVYVNIYSDGTAFHYPHEDVARNSPEFAGASRSRIAVAVPATFTPSD